MTKNYDKTFKSNPELLPDIEEYILNIVDTLTLPQTTRNNIELSVAEAAANCILHGNKSDHSKSVIIKLNINSAELRISFKDEGEGFKPNDVPDPTIPENILKGSGRGVHIMKSLVDKLDYNFTESGTELVLTFNLSELLNN